MSLKPIGIIAPLIVAALCCRPLPSFPLKDTGSGDAGSVPNVGIDWVKIEEGSLFVEAPVSGAPNEPDGGFSFVINVPSFEIARTETTVKQYKLFVETKAGETYVPVKYDPTRTWNICSLHSNWESSGRENHPVNCVGWDGARAFCDYVGGRLPSESEWTYAATSAGLTIPYPWCKTDADCMDPDCSFSVMDDDEQGPGCDMEHTFPVCSKPKGNTLQGLCDMAGNVSEVAQDWYHSVSDIDEDGEVDVPLDGSAWEEPRSEERVLRGGSWMDSSERLKTEYRVGVWPHTRSPTLGFRCVR